MVSALSLNGLADSFRRMDEIELEVFRADDRASRGISSDDIAQLADAYDGDANPVPVVIGHPKSDSPAQGTVKAFRAEGSKLFATLSGLKDELVNGLKDGSFINRSMAFFAPEHESNPTPGKLAPRHLGFLGGSAPGIPGLSPLKALSFNADDETLIVEGEPAEAIIFQAAPTPVRIIKEEPAKMDEDEKAEFEANKAKLEADRAKLESDRAEFAAQAENSRKAANKGRVAALVTAGKVLPADKDALEMVFDALDTGELEFAADDKGLAADKLADIIGRGPTLVDADGKRVSPDKAKQFEATGDFKADADAITAQARELMEKRPGLTFAAAVEEVSAEMEG